MPLSGSWKLALRALQHRNYRLFFAGQTVSLVGTWMTRVATSWLVYRLTGSAWMLGLAGFAGQIPTFFLSPLGGVWVDRWDRHRTLVVTQILSLVQSFALAALTLTGVVRVWHVMVLMLLQGAINSFDVPARQAFLVQMVDDRKDLPNAIAINSSMVNGARLIGPAVAGLLIAAWGEGWCFLIDGVSYIAVVFSLLAMRVKPRTVRLVETSAWTDLVEGWRYIIAFPAIRSVLLLLALVSLVGMPYTVLMPVIASTVFHGGAHTLGFLMSASGLGALAAGITLASRRHVAGLGRVVAGAAALFGTGLIAFSLSRALWLSLILLLASGFGFLLQLAGGNTILQSLVAEEKRGRVMSFHSMAFQGVAPFGSLAAGALAAHIGAPFTLALGGACCLAASAWFARLLPAFRHTIDRRGGD